MIQTLEDMIRRYCAFGMNYEDLEGYTHDWVSLLPGLEFAYNSTTHSTTEKTPFELERGYIPNSPRLLLNKQLGKLDIHPSSSVFFHLQALARDHAKNCISTAFAYEKKRWDKSHVEPVFKVGDQVLVSTVNIHNLGTNQKLKDPFIGPFPVLELVGKNALRLELHGAFARRHPVFPVSLIKMYKESDDTTFPKRVLRKKGLPTLEEETGVIHKILNKRIVKNGSKKELQFLVSFKNQPPDTERWLSAKDIPDSGILLRNFRVESRKKND